MSTALLASIAERRATLQALGPRPAYEDVEIAKRTIADLDAQLAEQLEVIYSSAAPNDVNVAQWREAQEFEKRELMEKQKDPYNAVIQLDGLHQHHEEMLAKEERELDGREYEPVSVPPPPAASESEDDVAELLHDALVNHGQSLDLRGRYMSHVPESFGRIVTLISLDLSGNQLELLSDSIAGLVNLQSLKVNSNRLKALPDSIGLLTKLKYLNVSSNVLKTLPESLGRCSSLVEVQANFNQIEFLCGSFGYELMNLEKLDLHLNKLSSVPSSFCDLISLKYLDLHMNKLKGLPTYIGNLSQLEYLNVSSNFNDMVSVPESMGSLISLTHCDLSFNQIRRLPPSFGKLQQLKTLKLDGNPIEEPPMDVVEGSQEALLDYVKDMWKRHVEAEQQGLEAGDPVHPGPYDYNAWVTWAGNSVNSWIGNWWGTAGPGANKSGDILPGQSRNNILEQQL